VGLRQVKQSVQGNTGEQDALENEPPDRESFGQGEGTSFIYVEGKGQPLAAAVALGAKDWSLSARHW
jgi:hypothetical protein